MTGRPGRRSAFALPLALSFLSFSLAGCSTAGTPGGECDCTTGQITINIPADIASSVTAVTLSGPACTNVTPTCANQTNGCTAYDFTATAGGECDVEVDKPSGVFEGQLTILAQSGCCTGFYPQGSSTIDVPEPEDGG